MNSPEVARGDRVELVHTDDAYTGLVPGCRGTVVRVSRALDELAVSVRWDDGSMLALLPDSGDRFRVLVYDTL